MSARQSASVRALPSPCRATVIVESRDEKRILKRQVLTYRGPAEIIEDAARLTKWDVLRVGLFTCAEPKLEVQLGTDDRGRKWTVHVALTRGQTIEVLTYLLRQDMVSSAWVWSRAFDSDEGGGEALPVPVISQSELAAMQPSGRPS